MELELNQVVTKKRESKFEEKKANLEAKHTKQAPEPVTQAPIYIQVIPKTIFSASKNDSLSFIEPPVHANNDFLNVMSIAERMQNVSSNLGIIPSSQST